MGCYSSVVPHRPGLTKHLQLLIIYSGAAMPPEETPDLPKMSPVIISVLMLIECQAKHLCASSSAALQRSETTEADGGHLQVFFDLLVRAGSLVSDGVRGCTNIIQSWTSSSVLQSPFTPQEESTYLWTPFTAQCFLFLLIFNYF